jgi:hypothetical protein
VPCPMASSCSNHLSVHLQVRKVMNRFWLISSLVFAEALTAPAAHAQTVPGSTGHGAPTFNCAVNDTYKDLDSGLVWRGNTFTASGCSSSTLVGGATAGSFHSGVAGACTVVITPGVPAASGWVCRANDLTTNTDSATWSQTASTTTTATISGTTASGDVVNFQCAPF